MFSPLYVAEAYGAVTATSPVPKFLSDFLLSVTNIGWILGVPILSSILVGGLFCLIGADKLKRVAIDDARRAPGTVSAIWFFLGVFFMTIGIPSAIHIAHALIIMAVFVGGLHFAFWGITEQHSNSNGNNQTNHRPRKINNET
ncbi:hypothetical protein [Acidithiobacillus thiooxidans]|uniref:hypothetical protein n=1 Tax=Acidithiobacillus thiooxidans TaxID=930 RepID=UPI003566908E|nr:hypothetical protein [Acidithiobacillus sp.]